MVEAGTAKTSRASHHRFADQLVTEFDRRAYQLAIALFEDSFLLTGLNQGIHIDCRLFFRAGRLLREGGDGEEEADEDADRRDHPKERANGPDEAHGPKATRAVEEERGQKLIAEDDDEDGRENGLCDFAVGGRAEMRGAIEEDCTELESDDAEGELLQYGCAERGVIAAEAEQRLDLGFPCVKILLHFAGEDFAEFGVDAADVGGEGFNDGQHDQRGNGAGRHGRAFGAARASMRPCGKTEAGAEQSFAASHLAGVGFVIVAGKMKQAMKDEDFDLIGKLVALGGGLAARRGNADGQVARNFFHSRAG